MYIYTWLIHSAAQQKLTQHCKGTILPCEKYKNKSPKVINLVFQRIGNLHIQTFPRTCGLFIVLLCLRSKICPHHIQICVVYQSLLQQLYLEGNINGFKCRGLIPISFNVFFSLILYTLFILFFLLYMMTSYQKYSQLFVFKQHTLKAQI